MSSIVLFYLIFSSIDVENYAIYGLTQSLALISSIFLSWNIETSFQKIYSKRRIRPYANLVLIIVLFGALAIWIFLAIILWLTGVVDLVYGYSTLRPSYFTLSVYCLSIGYLSVAVSLLNAARKTRVYGVGVVLPSLISITALLLRGHHDAESVLLVLAGANCLTITVIAVLCRQLFVRANYRGGHTRRLARYIYGYTSFSIPTLASKYLVDLGARSMLLAGGGEIAVSVLTFATTVMAIFRSIEQSFFRAIAPLILGSTRDLKANLKLATKLVGIQSVVTILVFSAAPIWIELLRVMFPSKPPSVFSAEVFMLFGLLSVISYYKNLSITMAKRDVVLMRSVYAISTGSNVLALFAVQLFVNSAVSFVIVQVAVGLLNLIALQLLILPRRPGRDVQV